MSGSSDASFNEQYDHITNAYAILYPPDGSLNPTLPTSLVEEAQLRSAVDSIGGLCGKRILELACGAGHYSSKYLAWGAESVTGLDISSGMLDAARAQAKAGEVSESKLRFLLGDATDDSLVIEGGPFDVVMACWLLNYAPNAEAMAQ
ncbi:hypothetical protein LTR53_013877, partial [Teratosphaeriaceae sp. CCFEE 6253]